MGEQVVMSLRGAVRPVVMDRMIVAAQRLERGEVGIRDRPRRQNEFFPDLQCREATVRVGMEL